MSLGSGERLLGGSQSTGGAYHMILTIPIPAAFRRVTIGVGNGSARVCGVTPDLRNDGVGV